MVEATVFVVSRNFENLTNNMFDDDLGRSGLLIQPRIFLAVAADRIARVFNMPFSDEAITFDISITFNKIWHAGLL